LATIVVPINNAALAIKGLVSVIVVPTVQAAEGARHNKYAEGPIFQGVEFRSDRV
jgi:hypothetical protein